MVVCSAAVSSDLEIPSTHPLTSVCENTEPYDYPHLGNDGQDFALVKSDPDT
jgi:hypothetical protein